MNKVLTKLGYTCYNDSTILKNMKQQIPIWKKYIDTNNESIKWKDVFQHDNNDNYTAAMGLPICLHWKEIIEYYPDCKVILLKRDVNKWYQSIFQTFGWLYPLTKFVTNCIPNSFLFKQYLYLTHLNNIGFKHYSFVKNKQAAIQSYNEYNKDIINYFESNRMQNRLFVIDFDANTHEKKEQFGQMLEFLGQRDDQSYFDQANTTFPHTNRRIFYFLGYCIVFAYIVNDISKKF